MNALLTPKTDARLKISIPDSLRDKLDGAAKQTGFSRNDLAKAFITSGLDQLSGDGVVIRAVSFLSPKTAGRMAEMDRVLVTAPGDGIAETLLSSLLEDIMEGDLSLVMDGWQWDDADQTAADLRCIADRWSSEDTLERIREEARVSADSMPSASAGKEGAPA